MFLCLSKNIIYLKKFENIFSLGCTIKNVQNTKMQLKKICHSQINRISAQVVKNFMSNNLEKKIHYLFKIKVFMEFLKHPNFAQNL